MWLQLKLKLRLSAGLSGRESQLSLPGLTLVWGHTCLRVLGVSPPPQSAGLSPISVAAANMVNSDAPTALVAFDGSTWPESCPENGQVANPQ